jgi:hypothetical protein
MSDECVATDIRQDTRVTPEQFSNVEVQAKTCEQAKALGQEIAARLQKQLKM